LASAPASSNTPLPTPTSGLTLPALERIVPPQATETPWIFPSGLTIEEHPLAQPPEIEPLVILPQDGLTQAEVLDKHKLEWTKPLPQHEYYSLGGGDVWVMQGNNKLETNFIQAVDGKAVAQVTRNGNVIFSTSILPPGTTSAFRVLSVYDNHWVFEVAQAKNPTPTNIGLVDSFFLGEIFIDGQSLDKLHGYDESFGFQTIDGRPFYFYKRSGKTGVFYDGLEIALDYDGVWHYGCCSGGELNPRMAQNIVSFFAWRGSQWYFTEIGVYGQPGKY